MIVFDLLCDAGHVFEAWFGSSADFTSQQERGLVECPLCGSGSVGKAVMAPRVAAKGNREISPAAPSALPVASGDATVERLKALMQAVAETQRKMLEGSDYVGAQFAEQARAMHDGQSEERPIHGIATPQEAKGLIDDGIPVAPLPLPVRPPGRDN